MSDTHELKVWPPYFAVLLNGSKTFELRKNDRRFAVGDVLRLREYDPVPNTYTGRQVERRVTYVLAGLEAAVFGLQPGFVILALGEVDS